MPNGLPPLPRSKSSPVGSQSPVDKVVSSLDRAINDVESWLINRFNAIESRKVSVNSSVHGYLINQDSYEYLIDLFQLDSIIAELEQKLEQLPTDAIVEQLELSYEAATGIEVTNLQSITDEYQRTIATVLVSEPYQRRIALIKSRVFEEMEGFKDETGRDLARVLSEAIENGLNPRDVTETIAQRFSVSKSRAERIARTEINQAQRRAILDEDADANERLGIMTRVLWFSALSPSTRKTHASRHGRAYTQAEVREFYSRDGNAINCKCGLRSVLVDSSGEPLPSNDKLLERMAVKRKEFED